MIENKPQIESSSGELKTREWLAVAILALVFLSLTIITLDSKPVNPPNSIRLNDPGRRGIEILVKGDVAYPGMYHLPAELSMREVLNLVQANPTADLRRFNLDRPIRHGRLLNIPKRAMITVHVTGAVKSHQSIVLPKGTTLEGLISQLEGIADENANLKPLQKKRKLRDNETIELHHLKNK